MPPTVDARDHLDPAIPVGMETSAGTVVSQRARARTSRRRPLILVSARASRCQLGDDMRVIEAWIAAYKTGMRSSRPCSMWVRYCGLLASHPSRKVISASCALITSSASLRISGS